ncbi:hypothetical protein PIB30_071317, partial [Stylosanthes scabra]|nr:hypothetical protein [Stylosanthes scabra]
MVTFGPCFKCEPNVTRTKTSSSSPHAPLVTFAPRLDVGQTWLKTSSRQAQDKLLIHISSHIWTMFPTWAKRDSPRLKASFPRFHQATFGPRFQRGPKTWSKHGSTNPMVQHNSKPHLSHVSTWPKRGLSLRSPRPCFAKKFVINSAED